MLFVLAEMPLLPEIVPFCATDTSPPADVARMPAPVPPVTLPLPLIMTAPAPEACAEMPAVVPLMAPSAVTVRLPLVVLAVMPVPLLPVTLPLTLIVTAPMPVALAKMPVVLPEMSPAPEIDSAPSATLALMPPLPVPVTAPKPEMVTLPVLFVLAEMPLLPEIVPFCVTETTPPPELAEMPAPVPPMTLPVPLIVIWAAPDALTVMPAPPAEKLPVPVTSIVPLLVTARIPAPACVALKNALLTKVNDPFAVVADTATLPAPVTVKAPLLVMVVAPSTARSSMPLSDDDRELEAFVVTLIVELVPVTFRFMPRPRPESIDEPSACMTVMFPPVVRKMPAVEFDVWLVRIVPLLVTATSPSAELTLMPWPARGTASVPIWPLLTIVIVPLPDRACMPSAFKVPVVVTVPLFVICTAPSATEA